jgi:hypothetical protein
MNISQPFIHRPIATSLPFQHRGKRSDYRPFNDAIIAHRNGSQSGLCDFGQAIPGPRHITLMVSPWSRGKWFAGRAVVPAVASCPREPIERLTLGAMQFKTAR